MCARSIRMLADESDEVIERPLAGEFVHALIIDEKDGRVGLDLEGPGEIFVDVCIDIVHGDSRASRSRDILQ